MIGSAPPSPRSRLSVDHAPTAIIGCPYTSRHDRFAAAGGSTHRVSPQRCRRGERSVIAETKQGFLVSLADIVAQCPLEDGSRRLQVAELEQDKTENAASDARFRGAAFGFPKEDLSCFTRLSILATHEARQRHRQTKAAGKPICSTYSRRATLRLYRNQSS
jgi:hypothetical protein